MTNLIDRIKTWLFYKGFKPIVHFESSTGLVELDFPENWRYKSSKYCYDFLSPDINGALQISAYVNQNSDYEVFNIDSELNDIQKRIEKPIIVQLGKYKAVHYSIKDDSQLIDYHWHTGYNNILVYITFNHDSEQTEEELDKEYRVIHEIIQTIKINAYL